MDDGYTETSEIFATRRTDAATLRTGGVDYRAAPFYGGAVAGADCLEVRVEHDGTVCRISVSGVLDVVTAGRFTERARSAVQVTAERLVLDLSSLSFMDCCGARALAAVAGAVHAQCAVIVRSPRPVVRRVLALTGMSASE